MSPWINPIANEMNTIMNSAPPTDQSCSVNNHGNPQPTKQITEPIERSMPPVMITNATPMLMMPNNDVRRIRFSRL